MSEYAVVPSYMIHKLPEGITTEQGTLAEPVAVGLRAAPDSARARAPSSSGSGP